MTSSLSASQIKQRRVTLGLSQQELADLTGLSIRTVQRIENGETTPRGFSLRKLAEVLKLTPEDVPVQDNSTTSFIMAVMHLLALSFFVKPFLGPVLPFLLWIWKKDESRELDTAGRRIINFELTLLLGLLLLYASFILLAPLGIFRNADGFFKFSYVVLQLLNIIVIIVNTILIYFRRSFWYTPVIPFLKVPQDGRPQENGFKQTQKAS